MANNKLLRVLHCKKASIQASTVSLEQRLRIALHGSTAADRSEPLDHDGAKNTFRLIAQHYPIGTGIGGVMTTFERGASAVTVVEDPSAKQIELAQLRPPRGTDGKQRQWVEGLLYFYVRGNFVVLIQSSAVRSGQFEEHLSWLFRAPGQPVGPAVTLADLPTLDARKRILKSHVKEVRIGGSLFGPTAVAANGAAKGSAALRVQGPLLEAVRGFLGAASKGFNWTKGLDGNIEAELKITYNRKTHDNAQQLLDQLAITLRNAGDVDTTIELNGDGTIKGKDLRLHTKTAIRSEDGVLLLGEALETMKRWMDSLIAEQQIIP